MTVFAMDLPNESMKIEPTKIERLSLDLNGNSFFIKREDLIPFCFGGNKARKAVGFFKEILAGGYDTVVTYGSSSSNHCRVVSNLAARYGLSCYVVSPEEGYSEKINSTLLSLCGAQIVKAPLDRIGETIDELLSVLSKNGKPYFIAGGGHGNLGSAAYVAAYNEIESYESQAGMAFDYIFHASGTGTTQAGLLCGAALAGKAERRIVGISIARSNPRGGEVVAQSVKDYLSSVGYKGQTPSVIFDDSYISGGYGKTNEQINKLIKEIYVRHGIALNATYTGKAFYGMTEYIKKHDVKNQSILFIHTGGVPLFFDDLGEII